MLGVLCVFLSDMLSIKLFPLPADVNPSNEAQLRQAMAAGRVPKGALICVLCGQTLAALVASFVAAWRSRKFKFWAGGTAGGLLFAASVANLASLPHPLYFAVATLLLVPAATLLGIFLGTRSPAKIVETCAT